MWQSVNGELKDKLRGTILSCVPPPAPEHLNFTIYYREGNQWINKYKSYIDYERHMIELLADDLPKDKTIPIVLNLEGIDDEVYPDYNFNPLTNKLINTLSKRTGHITIILDGYGENLRFVQNLPAEKLIFKELKGSTIPFHPRVKAVQVNEQDIGMEHCGFGTEILFYRQLEYIWIDVYLQGGYYHLEDTLSIDLTKGELAPNLKELHLSIKGSLESLNALLDAIDIHKYLESCEIIWMLTDKRYLDKIDLTCVSKIDNFILLIQESDGYINSCPSSFKHFIRDSDESDDESDNSEFVKVESDGYGDLIYIKGWGQTSKSK